VQTECFLYSSKAGLNAVLGLLYSMSVPSRKYQVSNASEYLLVLPNLTACVLLNVKLREGGDRV